MDRSTAGVSDKSIPTMMNIWLIGNPPIILVYPLIPLILVHTQILVYPLIPLILVHTQILVYPPIQSILVQIPKPHTKKPAFWASSYIKSLTKSKY